MPAWTVDGWMSWRWLMPRAGGDAIRAGGGPALPEACTYRFRAHSMFDPELYRDKEEIAHVARTRFDRSCCVRRLDLDDETWQQMEDRRSQRKSRIRWRGAE